MDIKFHVNRILKSGGDVDDWLDFIAQLKNKRTDRDLLLQIHTVALKNLKKVATVGYKKLMIGLANLQSEISLDLARETYLDAKALDLDCAIVCVFYAQFEFLNQNKEKARQIIVTAKKYGCAPKQILKRAYQNWRQNKLSLLDGIHDPWNICDNDTETGTGGTSGTHFQTTENKSCQIFDSIHVDTGEVKAKALPLPTRAVSKSNSGSSIAGKSKWQTPDVNSNKINAFESGENCVKKTVERHGPSMSPFMKTKYSPLVKRKFDIDVDSLSSDCGMIFPLVLSAEKCPFVTPIKNISRSSSEFEKEVCGSSDSCSSGMFTSNLLKESNSDLKKRIMKKSASSPCIFESNKYHPQVNLGKHLESVVESPDFNISDKHCKKDNEVKQEQDVLHGNVIVGCDDTASVQNNLKNENKGKVLNPSVNVNHSLNVFNSTLIPGGLTASEEKSFCSQSNVAISGNNQVADRDYLTSCANSAFNTKVSSVIQKTSAKQEFNEKDSSFSKPDPQHSLINGVTRNSNHCSNIKDTDEKTLPALNYPMKHDLDTEDEKRNIVEVENSFDKSLTTGGTIMNTQRKEEPAQKRTISPSFHNVFAANEKSKTVEKKFSKMDVSGISEVSDKTVQNEVSNAEVDGLANEKLTCNSEMLSEDSFKKVDYHAPVGNNVFSGPFTSQTKVSPTSYSVKGVRYHRKRVLGKGGSCKVYEVLSEYGDIFALKKVNLHDVDEFILNMYKNEIKFLEKMKGNMHIIKLVEWEVKDETLFIVLEKGDMDLAYALKNKTTLSSEEMKNFWKQIITAVKVIHENGIIHTDLKPANFLLVGNMLKLIDFGIANSIQDNKTSVTRECQMGTLNYMSPEVLVQDGCRVSRASDVWSLGCMLYYMIYKKTPYSDIKNHYTRFFALQQGKPIDYSGIGDKLLLDCLQGCLKHDRKERYSLQQLLDHPYLN